MTEDAAWRRRDQVASDKRCDESACSKRLHEPASTLVKRRRHGGRDSRVGFARMTRGIVRKTVTHFMWRRVSGCGNLEHAIRSWRTPLGNRCHGGSHEFVQTGLADAKLFRLARARKICACCGSSSERTPRPVAKSRTRLLLAHEFSRTVVQRPSVLHDGS